MENERLSAPTTINDAEKGLILIEVEVKAYTFNNKNTKKSRKIRKSLISTHRLFRTKRISHDFYVAFFVIWFSVVLDFLFRGYIKNCTRWRVEFFSTK
jgi:hypothetical protein